MQEQVSDAVVMSVRRGKSDCWLLESFSSNLQKGDNLEAGKSTRKGQNISLGMHVEWASWTGTCKVAFSELPQYEMEAAHTTHTCSQYDRAAALLLCQR